MERQKGRNTLPFFSRIGGRFATLHSCVHDFLGRLFDKRKEDIQIDRLYYKKSGRSKSLVSLHDDKDISGMLDEYPLTFPCGKRKTSSTIVMAVDWSQAKSRHGKCTTLSCENLTLPIQGYKRTII